MKRISIDKAIEIAKENFNNREAYRRYTGMGWESATRSIIRRLEELRD